ncbi:MAG TPA: pitrilysin family protein [Candidatus Paceibacterota bacterium]|nr:pitrilysin family protein [Candidatus Paceibacterota bacterium]
MKFERYDLDCGASFFAFPMPHMQSVATGIRVNAGTRDEDWTKTGAGIPREAGLAHACEHMLFQGNARFGNSKETTAYLEDVGGVANAFTSKEITFYYNVLPSRHALRAPVYLYHLLSEPLLRPEDIRKEMQNILEEIKMYYDNPETYAEIVFEEIAYGDHPLAKCALGTSEAVSAFSREDFLRYRSRFYHTGNFTFIAVGNFDPGKMAAQFNSLFGAQKQGTKNVRARESSITHKKIVDVAGRDIQQLHVFLGAPIGPAEDRSTLALEVFTNMLSGGMSFPLFQEVRDKRGLCYAVEAGLSACTDRSLFHVYLGTDPARSREAVSAVEEVVVKSMDDQALFFRAKELMIGRMALQFESPAKILYSAAESTAPEDVPQSPEEKIAEIESVEFEEVKAAAERYLLPSNFIRTFVGPKDFTV